jgi:hypothetical protein
MSELAKECMNELDLIRQAQEELDKELDRIWLDIEHRIQDEIKEMTDNLQMPMRRNESTDGHYRSSASYRDNNEKLPRICIEVHDPREPDLGMRNKYRIRVFWSGSDRKQFFKSSPKAKLRLDELAKAEGVTLLPATERDCCEKCVDVMPDNLDETVAQVSDTIISYYRMVTAFLKWLQNETPPSGAENQQAARRHK